MSGMGFVNEANSSFAQSPNHRFSHDQATEMVEVRGRLRDVIVSCLVVGLKLKALCAAPPTVTDVTVLTIPITRMLSMNREFTPE